MSAVGDVNWIYYDSDGVSHCTECRIDQDSECTGQCCECQDRGMEDDA